MKWKKPKGKKKYKILTNYSINLVKKLKLTSINMLVILITPT